MMIYEGWFKGVVQDAHVRKAGSRPLVACTVFFPKLGMSLVVHITTRLFPAAVVALGDSDPTVAVASFGGNQDITAAYLADTLPGNTFKFYLHSYTNQVGELRQGLSGLLPADAEVVEDGA